MNNVNADKASSVKLGAVLKVCALLSVLLVFLTLAGVITASFLVPRRYYSKVTMEVREPQSTFGPVGAPQPPDPQYIQTQLAILQKTEVLYPVIQWLDLRKAYAPTGKVLSQAEAYQRLRASMKLQGVRNTGLVEIGITDTDAQRAANIANAIARAYQEKAAEADRAITEEGQRALEADIAAQRQQMEEAFRHASEIRARDGIADPDPENEFSTLSNPALAAAANQDPATKTAQAIEAKSRTTEYVDAKKQAIRARKILETMELANAQSKISAHLAVTSAKIWEKAEKADQPETRIASLVDNVLH